VKILGIDPGLAGGLALLCPHDGIILEPMFIDDEGKLDVVKLALWIGGHASEIRVCYLEKVNGAPIGGRQKGSFGAFNFGMGFGILRGILAACGVRTVLVRPQEWQKVMHKGLDPKQDSKLRSYEAFEKIFPDIDAYKTDRSKKPHEGMVEALLIAEFGRRSLE